MDEQEKGVLKEIQRQLEQTDRRFARRFRDSRRQLARNCPEAVEFRKNLKIVLLVTVVSIAVVALALVLFLWYVHYHPIHAPDMPYSPLGR